jgi:hypothetical protein
VWRAPAAAAGWGREKVESGLRGGWTARVGTWGESAGQQKSGGAPIQNCMWVVLEKKGFDPEFSLLDVKIKFK